MHILIDGQNVCFVRGKTHPCVEALDALLHHLEARTIAYTCFLERTPPLFPRYRKGAPRPEPKSALEIQVALLIRTHGDANFCINLPGTESDDHILTMASSDTNYHIISNDRFSDKRDSYDLGLIRSRLHVFALSGKALTIPSLKWVVPLEQLAATPPTLVCDTCAVPRGTGLYRSDDGKPDLVWKCSNCGKLVCRGCIETYTVVGYERVCRCGCLIGAPQRLDANKTVAW
jgi:hypothetical protein